MRALRVLGGDGDHQTHVVQSSHPAAGCGVDQGLRARDQEDRAVVRGSLEAALNENHAVELERRRCSFWSANARQN